MIWLSKVVCITYYVINSFYFFHIDINCFSISFVLYFRKDFEKKLQEREVEEAIERIRYRKQLDEKSDREKEKIAGFYKDVSNFQVIYNILIK